MGCGLQITASFAIPLGLEYLTLFERRILEYFTKIETEIPCQPWYAIWRFRE